MMMLGLLIIFATINLNSARGAAFHFPTFKFVDLPSGEVSNAPHTQNSPKDTAELKKRFIKYCKDVSDDKASYCWEPHLRESYEVASSIFEKISLTARQRQIDRPPSVPRDQLILSYPSMTKPENLVKISKVLQSDKCKRLLG